MLPHRFFTCFEKRRFNKINFKSKPSKIPCINIAEEATERFIKYSMLKQKHMSIHSFTVRIIHFIRILRLKFEKF